MIIITEHVSIKAASLSLSFPLLSLSVTLGCEVWCQYVSTLTALRPDDDLGMLKHLQACLTLVTNLAGA